MNAPIQSTPSLDELKNSKQLENTKQRGDYTGQFTDDVDNSEEIRAIENDPTQFPNSTRVYIAGQIHRGRERFRCERSDSRTPNIPMVSSRRTILFESTTAQVHGAILNLKAT